MSRRLVVDVTQDDIDRGARTMAYECPIARAMSRRLDKPRVGYDTASGRVAGSHLRRLYTLSRRASDFARRFDRGLAVQPSRFVLTYRDEFVEVMS